MQKTENTKQPISRDVKKKIIVLCSVFLVAAILFGVYFAFLRDDGNETVSYPSLGENTLKLKDVDYGDITLSFGDTAEKLDADANLSYVKLYAGSFAHNFENISVEYGNGGSFCTVKGDKKTVEISQDKFFNKFENGTIYTVNAERVFAMAILEASGNADGKNPEDYPIAGVNGYDYDGDTVGSSGRAFVYPAVSRSDVKEFKIRNEVDSYRVYRQGQTFYFENAELSSYDDTKFAQFVVNCTYMLSVGKISNVPQSELEKYGLASEEKAKAVVQVTLLDDTVHKVLIGAKHPSGSGYYAKYEGKPHVYVLSTTIEADILASPVAMFTPNLGYNVGSTNDIYDVDDVLLMYKNPETTVYISKRYDIFIPENIKQYNSEQVLGELLHDKTYFSGSYSDWRTDAKAVGFSSNGADYLEFRMCLQQYSKEGKYSVKMGFVKDKSASAILPEKISVLAYDNDKKEYVQVTEFSNFDQSEKSYKQYEIPFEFGAGQRLTDIKVVIKVPTGGYMVTDEITVCRDGWDAIPNDAASGIWKIVSPDSFVKDGYNYSFPDTTTFAEILYGMATLVADEAIEYNIDENTIKEYGLETPDIALSYLFKGYRSYIYFSAPDKDGNRYAYSSISFTDSDGETVDLSTGIISKVYAKSAPWLQWEPLEFLETSTMAMMYIDRMDAMEFEFEGKTYLFELSKGSDGKVNGVTLDGKEIILEDFRHTYMSILQCGRAGEIEGDVGEKTQLFRIKVHSKVKETEIIYYRVTSTKVVYETDGEPSNYYALYSDIANIINNIKLLLEGKEVPT